MERSTCDSMQCLMHAQHSDEAALDSGSQQPTRRRLSCRWESGSYGYHGDDGRKFNNSEKGEEYGPKFGTGDTVGACLHFEKEEIFFT